MQNRSLGTFARVSGAVAALCLAVCAPAGAADAERLDSGALVEGLQGWIDATRDLRSRFEQTMTSGALGSGLSESGRLFLQRPGRMRWDYLDPERKVALIDGDRTRVYLEEDRQLWEGRLDESNALLLTLLAGSRPIDEMFEASLLERPTSARDVYRLRLVPLGDADAFREIVVSLRPPRFALREVEVLDGAGNRMRYRFSEIRRNRGLDASVFHFEPPAGTEIVARP